MSSPDPASPHAPTTLPITPVRRHAIVGHLDRRLREHCEVARGERLIIGVSGGPDSLALLIAAAALRERTRAGGPGLDPIAAHVHHHLRPEADAEAQHVAAVCADLRVACHVLDIAPAGLPGSLAANARRLRYDALATVARDTGAPAVAVAHHVEDQFETLLMGLCRDGGLAGLTGMPWRRRLGEHVALVRPLLDISKRDCEDLCRAAGIDWCRDPGNDDPATPRGRLRREVAPVLESLWPGAVGRATRTADAVRDALALQAERVAELFGPPTRRSWPRAALAACPVSLLAAGLRRALLDEVGFDRPMPGSRQLEEAAAAVRDGIHRPREFQWPEGVRLRISAREVTLE